MKSGADGTISLQTKEGEVLDGLDHALFAIGRVPLTEGLGLEKCGVEMDSRGFIPTNKFEETNIKNIFALGDVNGTLQRVREVCSRLTHSFSSL